MRLYESVDGFELLPVASVESLGDGRMVTFLRRRESHPGEIIRVEPGDERWVALDFPDDLPPTAWRCCVRCRRLNAGPCISFTCVDLQVVRG